MNSENSTTTTGTIYYDHGSKGWQNGKRVFKDCWRAEITIDGQRYRHRSKERIDCEEWLKAVKCKRIRPTDNKADWWRMEQHKDESVRIDEIIVSQAEESVLLYEYHQTGDLSKINELCSHAGFRQRPYTHSIASGYRATAYPYHGRQTDTEHDIHLQEDATSTQGAW